MTRLGITGHQRLADASAWAWARRELALILRQSPDPLVGVSSLAVGVDQLFADLILQQGGALEVVIPFPGYLRTFSAERDAREYQRLLSSASEVVTLRRDGPDEEAFMEAGKRVVNSCDLLLAVWDGRPAAGLGGTADVVGYAVGQRKNVIHLNVTTRNVAPV